MRPPSAAHPLAAGRATELLVQAHAMIGSEFRLATYQPVADDAHVDLVVVEKGRYGALYLQVKSCAGLDGEGRVVAVASYPEDAVPESARFLYVVCLLDPVAQALGRCWLVPSAEFNRRAYREHRDAEPGRVTLQFSARAQGDPQWDGFELRAVEIGASLEACLETSPPDPGLAAALRLP